MNSDLRVAVQRLLERLPTEFQLDLGDAALRLQKDPSLKLRVKGLIEESAHQERIFQELFGCGPLEPLLVDEAVTEILVNGADSIWCERAGRFEKFSDQFLSAFTLAQFVHLICQESRLRLDLSQPFADGMWRGFRVHLGLAPLVGPSHTVCLRRHPLHAWTLQALETASWADASAMASIHRLLQERWNLMVIGPTGSGKTSVLSALLRDVPTHERVVIIEDTAEIQPANDLCTKLLTRSDDQGILKNFDQGALLRQSLRMRPDRLVVGEVRGAEAKDLLLALSTGHSGSFGSLHARSARQALLRLEMLIAMGAPDWSLETIRQLIHLSLNALIVVELKNGQRRLEGIYQIVSLEKCGFLMEKINS